MQVTKEQKQSCIFCDVSREYMDTFYIPPLEEYSTVCKKCFPTFEKLKNKHSYLWDYSNFM